MSSLNDSFFVIDQKLLVILLCKSLGIAECFGSPFDLLDELAEGEDVPKA